MSAQFVEGTKGRLIPEDSREAGIPEKERKRVEIPDEKLEVK